MVTSFVRDGEGRVHAYYYITNKAGVFILSGEYDNRQLNLGGSTSHGATLGSAVINGATFLPLGSIEVCPPEIKVDSKFKKTTTPSSGNPASSCKAPRIAEPPGCKDAAIARAEKDFCKGIGDDEYENLQSKSIDWCNPESCGPLLKAAPDLCNGRAAGACAKYTSGIVMGQLGLEKFMT